MVGWGWTESNERQITEIFVIAVEKILRALRCECETHYNTREYIRAESSYSCVYVLFYWVLVVSY